MVTNNLTYPQAAAVCSFDHRDHLRLVPLVSTTRDEETFIPTSLVPPLAADADCSLTRMAFLSEMALLPIRLHFPILTLTHQKPTPLEAPLQESYGGQISPSKIQCLRSRNSFWATRKNTECGRMVQQKKRLPSPGVEARRGSMLRC